MNTVEMTATTVPVVNDVERSPILRGRWRFSLTEHWPALFAASIAFGLAVYQLARPNALQGVHGYSDIGYDDGVYLGSALRMTHGLLPYADYTFLHPPGITWLMAPFAIVGRITSEQDALVLARCFTALVVGANAALGALILRRRGTAAMLTAGIALACFPLGVAATHSVMLEPYLVLFCLLGVVTLFDGGDLAAPGRLLYAGLFFGFAGAVKVWAILAVLAAIIVLFRKWRTHLRPFVTGLALGFALPTLPFALIAPKAFANDVILAQLGRGTSGRSAYSVAERLPMMFGITFSYPSVHDTQRAKWLVVALVALVALVLALAWRRTTRLDGYVIAATVCVYGGMFKPPQFYDHYAYFSAAFGALLFGICVGSLADLLEYEREPLGGAASRALHATKAVVLPVLLIGTGLAAILINADRARSYLGESADPSVVIANTVPSGACVVTDMPILLLIADRFSSSRSCPGVIDPFGLWLTDNGGDPPGAKPPFPLAFRAKWLSWMETADYAVLSVRYSNYIPWSPDLITWFNASYQLVAEGPRTFVYRHLR